MPRRHVWVGVVVILSVLTVPRLALADPATDRVEAARKLLVAGKHADAAKAVEAALAQSGNTEETVLALFELSGIAAAQLKQTQKARTAFQRVFSLDPSHKLTGKWPARVTSLFTEAKRSMARAGGKLSLEQLTPEIKGNQVVAIYFSIENDVLKLGKKARVHLRQDSGAWAVREVPVEPTMKADTAARTVEWWAELLGERDEPLAHVASEEKPLLDAVPGAPPPKKDDGTKSAAAKTGAPVAAKQPELTPTPREPPPAVVAPPTKTASKVRILPWALVGGGVAAGAVGAIFGVKAQGERAKVTGAPVDTNGVVTTMTRAQALKLDAAARSDSAIANSLMAAGIGLAVTGGVVWFLGRE